MKANPNRPGETQLLLRVVAAVIEANPHGEPLVFDDGRFFWDDEASQRDASWALRALSELDDVAEEWLGECRAAVGLEDDESLGYFSFALVDGELSIEFGTVLDDCACFDHLDGHGMRDDCAACMTVYNEADGFSMRSDAFADLEDSLRPHAPTWRDEARRSAFAPKNDSP